MTSSINHNTLPLTLLLGGVRAGKSAKAQRLAMSNDKQDSVLFVATAQSFDAEMERRIATHRADRPATWHTLEEPIEIASAIDAYLATHPATATVVIDCITLWVSNLLLQTAQKDDAEHIAAQATRTLLDVMQRNTSIGSARRHWIIVSNEVGLGVVPPTPLGRLYRDALGRANQLLAAAADDVRLMVAGLEIPLKTPSPT